MSDLFGDIAAHDPGGKVRLQMLAGARGAADISACGRYRHSLSRCWGELGEEPEPFALWIGMNPSTADAMVDDPTVRREIGFTQRLGLRSYVKTNVMDYRATSPKDLLAPGVAPCSEKNRATILAYAREAAKVVLVYGALPNRLRPYASRVLAALRAEGIGLWCLGRSKDGSPRHPLYLRSDTPFELFAPAPSQEPV